MESFNNVAVVEVEVEDTDAVVVTPEQLTELLTAAALRCARVGNYDAASLAIRAVRHIDSQQR